jgi:hypothetical protein
MMPTPAKFASVLSRTSHLISATQYCAQFSIALNTYAQSEVLFRAR